MASEHDAMENESTLGVLIVLFLIVVGTIYVVTQQQQQQQQQQQRLQQRRGGGATGAATGMGGRASLAHNAIVTASLNEKQLRLHRSLPSRNGARTVTICVDALLQRHPEATSQLAWRHDEMARVLADLLAVADVYVLCKVESDDAAASERVQRFLTETTTAAAKNDDDDASVPAAASASSRSLLPHKILFCTTNIGKVAFVRQLEPHVHVEVDAAVVRELDKHVPRIVHVQALSAGAMAVPPATSRHHATESFLAYFDMLSMS